MNNIKKYPIIGGKYEHYKGGKYEVITMATNTETDEALVIYKSLLFGSIYARPLEQWFEIIELKDKTKIKRFQRDE